MAAVLAETGKVKNLDDLLVQASSRIATALGLPPNEARLEARVLAAHALRVNRAWLVAHGLDSPTGEQASAIKTLIHRRERGEPVAYLLGEKEFYGRVFKVSPHVLIPRPETEHLVQAALDRLPPDKSCRVLDLGTGSGAIAITLALARPRNRILGTDICAQAVEVARSNAKQHRADNAEFRTGDWYQGLTVEKFDMIVSNPPYLAASDPHLACLHREPEHALVSGVQGLDALRAIIGGAPAHLTPGGWLLVEHGWDQAEQVAAMLGSNGFKALASEPDLAGHMRVSGGQLSGNFTLRRTAHRSPQQPVLPGHTP